MSKSKKDIKILVACHKPSYVPDNDLLLPIQVGTALGQKIPNLTHDDSGDNISEKNRSFCEMTAIYWAWKNLDADYYGLFHYRRYFSFADEIFPQNPFAEAHMNDIEGHLDMLGLDEARMREVIEAHDIIAPTPGRFVEAGLTMYKQYDLATMHYIKDLDFVLDYLKENYPYMVKAADEAMNSVWGYFCNMFVLTKELFLEYCEFIFDCLFAFDKAIDYSNYDIEEYRVVGFLAERLTNIWLTYKRNTKTYSFKELQKVFFDKPGSAKLSPLREKDNVAIVLAANDYYVPYMSALIESIAQNANEKDLYDINIFHRDISPENQAIMAKQFMSYGNIKLRYYDITPYMEKYEHLHTRGHFALETYFRLFIQEIMIGYSKVLYLDADMVVEADVAPLFYEDVKDYILAACLDPDTAGLYKGGFEPGRREYTDEKLRLEKPYEYFQAGTILFNLDEMRKQWDINEILEFALSYEWRLLDQDVLNYFAQGKVKFVDMAYNVMYNWRGIRINEIIKKAPMQLYLDYMDARANPKIIHYAGPEKPWMEADCDFAERFWFYAKCTPYYEVILSRMMIWLGQHKVRKAGIIIRILRKIKRSIKPAFSVFFPESSRRRAWVRRTIRRVRG
jgi:lipopolysaccharide biosynthesis glycosyltransferase